MKTKTRLCAKAILLVLAGAALSAFPAHGQGTDASFKPVKRVVPDYPVVLSRMGIGGVVRLEVSVGADGNVEDIAVRGGGAILAEAAVKAVKQWKFPPSGGKKVVDVSVEFQCCHTIKMTP